MKGFVNIEGDNMEAILNWRRLSAWKKGVVIITAIIAIIKISYFVIGAENMDLSIDAFGNLIMLC